MSQRLLTRLIVALALLVPIALSAQTFVPKSPLPKPTFLQKDLSKLPSTLSITLNPALSGPARLKYSSAGQTLDVQGETVNITYEATGLTVEIQEGSYAATTTKEPFQSRNKGTFKSLTAAFAPNGDLTSYQIDKR